MPKSLKNLHFDQFSEDMSPLPSRATALISKNSSKANLIKKDEKLH